MRAINSLLSAICLLALAAAPTALPASADTIRIQGTLRDAGGQTANVVLEMDPSGGPVKGTFSSRNTSTGVLGSYTITLKGDITGTLKDNRMVAKLKVLATYDPPDLAPQEETHTMEGSFDFAAGKARGTMDGNASQAWELTFPPVSPARPTSAPAPGPMKLSIEGGWQRVAADGVSKLRLVAELPPGVSADAVQFQMTFPEKPTGSGGALGKQVTDGKAVATYKPPASLDKPFAVDVVATATTSGKQSLQARVSFEVVHTPVLLIHGVWSNSEVWALGEELLEAWGFRYVSRYNYSSCNSCDPAATIEPNLTRQIQDPENGFLARVKRDKTLASRYDLVGHSLGGLVARQHVVTGSNYRQVRKVVTVGTLHLGSEFADWYHYFERSKTQDQKEQNAPTEVVNHPNWQSGPSGRNWDNDEFDWLKNQVRKSQKLDASFFVDGPAVDALRPKGDFLKKLNAVDHHPDQVSYYLIYGTSPLVSPEEAPGLRDGLRMISRAANEVMHDTFLDHVTKRGTDGVVSIESATGGWYRFDPTKGSVDPTDGSAKRVPFKPKAIRGVAAHHVSIPSEAAALASLALRGDLDKPYVRFTTGKLHSPAHLHAYDDKGRHVGLNAQGKPEIGIPGAVYTGAEESTGVPETILIPDETPVRFEIKGYREGSFGVTVRRSTGSSDQETSFRKVAIHPGQTAVLRPEGAGYGELETQTGRIKPASVANHQVQAIAGQPMSGQTFTGGNSPSGQPNRKPEEGPDLSWLWWTGGAIVGGGLALLIQRARRPPQAAAPSAGYPYPGSPVATPPAKPVRGAAPERRAQPDLPHRFCGRCGRPLPPGARFCGICGASIRE